MSTFSKSTLSASTDGRAIKVTANSTPGTLIHTGSSDPTIMHEVWLWVANTDTSDRKLTVEWGGTTSPDDLIEMSVLAESGLFVVAPGLLIKGNATPLVIRAFGSSSNVLQIHGFVNVIA